MSKFNTGQEYSLDEIRRAFGGRGGNQMPVVVKDGHDLLYIKFQAKMNERWADKHELWIHDTDRRMQDASEWANSGRALPVFCGNGAGRWKYLGEAKAEIEATGKKAKSHTSNSKVGLVLRMRFLSESGATAREIITRKVKSIIRRAS